MSAWLHRQRKQTLIDLSKEAGLQQDEDTLKEEIITALDRHLQANASSLSTRQALEPYYGSSRRTPGRPSTAVPGTITSGDEDGMKSVVRTKGRIATKVKQEHIDGEASTSSPSQAVAKSSSTVARTTKTPARTQSSQSQSGRRRSSIPASPAIIAQEVEDRTLAFYDRLTSSYTKSPIPNLVAAVRDSCSSVTAITTTFTLLEAFSLHANLLPWKYAFDIPSLHLPFLGRLFSGPISVKLPDLFALLTSYYWMTLLLWIATSLATPALVAYFFNLSVKHVKKAGLAYDVPRYAVDPMTFHIAKALATFLVYAPKSSGLAGLLAGGYTTADAVARVNQCVYGGYQGIMVGSYVGILGSLYEAAQRK